MAWVQFLTYAPVLCYLGNLGDPQEGPCVSDVQVYSQNSPYLRIRVRPAPPLEGFMFPTHLGISQRTLPKPNKRIKGSAHAPLNTQKVTLET